MYRFAGVCRYECTVCMQEGMNDKHAYVTQDMKESEREREFEKLEKNNE